MPPSTECNADLLCDAACRVVGRDARLLYVARDKVKGVAHHAKAGNINSCLLKEGPGQGQFMVVLDCDMVVHPDFLLRTLGHFYAPAVPGTPGAVLSPAAAAANTAPQAGEAQAQGKGAAEELQAASEGSTAPSAALVPADCVGGWAVGGRVAPVDTSGSSSFACHPSAAPEQAIELLLGSNRDSYMRRHSAWVLKPKTAFLQTPQDFWNVDASDPMVHCARFFYGPMLQGRDGIGACPCCGTGVIFRCAAGCTGSGNAASGSARYRSMAAAAGLRTGGVLDCCCVKVTNQCSATTQYLMY
jgi:hypothetical protein